MTLDQDSKTLLIAGMLAFLLEFVLLTGIAWHDHWLAHPQRQGIDDTKFIDAELFQIPIPQEAKLTSVKPTVAPATKEAVLSKTPNQGRKAKNADETKTDEQNQTVQGAPIAPTHGPIAIFSPPPVIPTYLREREIKTSVVIEFLVTYQGAVMPRLLSSSGNEELDQIALSKVKQWKFRAAEQEHKPIDSKVRLRIVFEVQ